MTSAERLSPKIHPHLAIARAMNAEGATLQEIGDLVGLSRERARQLIRVSDGKVREFRIRCNRVLLGAGLAHLYDSDEMKAAVDLMAGCYLSKPFGLNAARLADMLAVIAELEPPKPDSVTPFDPAP